LSKEKAEEAADELEKLIKEATQLGVGLREAPW
jgi:hypothetical protein